MGERYAKSYSCVGHITRFYSSHQNSYRFLWSTFVIITLLTFMLLKASCVWINMPLSLVRASIMEQISPSTWCHLSMLIRFSEVGIAYNLSLKQAAWWCGVHSAMLTVSANQYYRLTSSIHFCIDYIDLVQPKMSTFSTRALIWVHYKVVH